MNVHYRKGSLLDYDGVYLTEGEWPAKAYFDAMRQARKRDAGLYMDYGYTRPNVVSRGPIQQGCSTDCESGAGPTMGAPTASPEQVMPEGQVPEESLPAPASRPADTVPPAGAGANALHDADERQAYYSPRQAPVDAAERARPKLGWAGEGLRRQPAYGFSRFGIAAVGGCTGRV